MVTGYDVENNRNLAKIADALERISHAALDLAREGEHFCASQAKAAAQLERIADALAPIADPHPGRALIHREILDEVRLEMSRTDENTTDGIPTFLDYADDVARRFLRIVEVEPNS